MIQQKNLSNNQWNSESVTGDCQNQQVLEANEPNKQNSSSGAPRKLADIYRQLEST